MAERNTLHVAATGKGDQSGSNEFNAMPANDLSEAMRYQNRDFGVAFESGQYTFNSTIFLPNNQMALLSRFVQVWARP